MLDNLLLSLGVFCLTMWFGAYLLARDVHNAGLRFAGLGLVTYALGLGISALAGQHPAFETVWTESAMVFLLFPAACWLSAVWQVVPEPPRGGWAILPFAAVALALFALVLNPTAGCTLALVFSTALLITSLAWVTRAQRRGLPARPMIALWTGSLFFLGSGAMLLLPDSIISDQVVYLLVGGDVLLMGAAFAGLDAHDEGTTFIPGAVRSLLANGLLVALVGGQAVIAMLVSGGRSAAWDVLLFSLCATIIGAVTLARPVGRWLDRVAFAGQPEVQRERAELADVNSALPNLNPAASPALLDEAEFARLTRRALSHYNDLSKLAASPLTSLPLIDQRLKDARKGDSQLERTHELKAVLLEAIVRLKPYSDADFSPSDEWRYYNALYFPYVAGLKPYSVRQLPGELDPTTRAALDWFQQAVPERTLYHWQTTAAKLVAQTLQAWGEKVM